MTDSNTPDRSGPEWNPPPARTPPPPPPPKDPAKPEAETIEFTEVHRAAATRAHVAGLVAVIDRGPVEPKSEEHKGELTPAEAEAEKSRIILAKRERDEWHKEHPEPDILQMSRADAQHAVSVDPDRYVMIPWTLRNPVSLEERVARLEQRMDAHEKASK